QEVENQADSRRGAFLRAAGEPGLRRFGSIFHRRFNGPSEIVEDYPSPGPKQQVDTRKPETCGVPCMAAVEVAEIELRTRHSLDHLGEFQVYERSAKIGVTRCASPSVDSTSLMFGLRVRAFFISKVTRCPRPRSSRIAAK